MSMGHRVYIYTTVNTRAFKRRSTCFGPSVFESDQGEANKQISESGCQLVVNQKHLEAEPMTC